MDVSGLKSVYGVSMAKIVMTRPHPPRVISGKSYFHTPIIVGSVEHA